MIYKPNKWLCPKQNLWIRPWFSRVENFANLDERENKKERARTPGALDGSLTIHKHQVSITKRNIIVGQKKEI